MVPAYGSPSPARMRMVVVLPAPLRPTSPMRSPGCTRSAGPSADSSVRAPARTSRSVAVITPLSSFPLLLVGTRRFLARALVSARRFLARALVSELRGPLFRARSHRFFEVGGEEADEKLAKALSLHMPFQASGVQSSPQCALGQLDSRPGEAGDPLCHVIAGV